MIDYVHKQHHLKKKKRSNNKGKGRRGKRLDFLVLTTLYFLFGHNNALYRPTTEGGGVVVGVECRLEVGIDEGEYIKYKQAFPLLPKVCPYNGGGEGGDPQALNCVGYELEFLTNYWI